MGISKRKNNTIMAEDEENQAKQFKMSDDQGNDVTHWRSFNAKGSAQYTNGDKYDGDFAKGRRHGTGTMVYQNSDVYEGQWCENQNMQTKPNKEHITGISLKVKDAEMVYSCMPIKIDTLDPGKTLSNMVKEHISLMRSTSN